MASGTIVVSSEVGRFARFAAFAWLAATSSGCICIVRNLEISRVEPQLLTSIIPNGAASRAGLKQTVKIQYIDGMSILYRSGVYVSGDSLIGDGLRSAPDALSAPWLVKSSPALGIAGIVTFRERTNAGTSVAASLAGTLLTAAVLGALAASAANSLGDSMDEAVACWLGGCSSSISTARSLWPGSRIPGASPPASAPHPRLLHRGRFP